MDWKSRTWHGVKRLGVAATNQQRRRTTPEAQPIMHVMLDLIDELFDSLPDVLPIRLASYDDLIGYFSVHQPQHQSSTKGAILRSPHADGIVLTQVFLTTNNSILLRPDNRPYGRQFLVGQIDDGLAQAFGASDLIIVE